MNGDSREGGGRRLPASSHRGSETRKWSPVVYRHQRSASEIVQLPAIGNAAFARGDNDGALLAYTDAVHVASAQLKEVASGLAEDGSEFAGSRSPNGLTAEEVRRLRNPWTEMSVNI